jgi:hypothetical protein
VSQSGNVAESLCAPAQLRWREPAETGGRDILEYVLHLTPAPGGMEQQPDAEVGRFLLWWCEDRWLWSTIEAFGRQSAWWAHGGS